MNLFPSRSVCLLSAIAVAFWGVAASAAERTIVTGSVAYQPAADESAIDERFRLESHEFPYAMRSLGAISDDLAIWNVSFPSPVTTDEVVNNTVHCEFYQPLVDGAPAKDCRGVVVLHILGGDFPMTRVYCNMLAHHGVAALFVKMPNYGPRRDPQSSKRMISHDPVQTVVGMTQAILDIRRAAAWLAQRPEVDADRLGVSGVSLGGITATLAAECDPRFKSVCPILAGGDLGAMAAQSPEFERVRRFWRSRGGGQQELLELLQKIDPVTYAKNLHGRRILMINADEDEVVPKVCTEALWTALGKPPITWRRGGHYSVGRHFFKIMDEAVAFFAEGP